VGLTKAEGAAAHAARALEQMFAHAGDILGNVPDVAARAREKALSAKVAPHPVDKSAGVLKHGRLLSPLSTGQRTGHYTFT